MRKSSWLTGLGVAILGLTLMANEKPSEAYVKAMKDMGAAQTGLRAAVTAKDYDTVAKHAATFKAGFAAAEQFWSAKNVADAVSAAQAGAKAASDLETAARGKNDEGIAAAQRAVGGTCQGCHMAHRERLADGTYEIK